MKRCIYYILSAVLLITACSKDQRVTKKIDGVWIAKSIELNGAKENYKYGLETKLEFNACNGEKEKCSGVFYSPKVCYECTHPFYTNTIDDCTSQEYAEEVIESYEESSYTCNITEESYYNNYFEFDMSNKGTTIEMYVYSTSGVFLYHGKVEDVEKSTMKLVLYPGDGNKLVYELEREK